MEKSSIPTAKIVYWEDAGSWLGYLQGGGYRRRVKRAALLKKIKQAGCVLVRHGARYGWYRYPETGVYQPEPRHREIRERLAKHILAQLGCR